MTLALLHMPAIERFGQYDLLKRIAVGGMGEIFLARERGSKARLVVLKRLLPQHAEQQRYEEMFDDEARLASLADHPGICRVYSSGEIEGKRYLAMEWIHGVPLNRIIYRSGGAGLPVPVVLRTLSDVAGAIAYSHLLTDELGRSLEVIHRDITPPNIMLGFEGVVKLLDFGLAKARTQEHSTESGYIKGKFRYLAPEQLDEEREFDWRVDVFSLGLCGFEALTGRHLFDSDNPVDAVYAIQEYAGPPEIRGLRPETPPELDAILRRALARKPALRFQTVAAMQEALEQLLEAVAPRFGARQMGDFVTRLFPKEAATGIV